MVSVVRTANLLREELRAHRQARLHATRRQRQPLRLRAEYARRDVDVAFLLEVAATAVAIERPLRADEIARVGVEQVELDARRGVAVPTQRDETDAARVLGLGLT